MSDWLLETRDVTRKFGELTAVDRVNFTVPAGEFRSVIGPNGAGKTTLFNLLSGVLQPTDGTIWFDGEDVTTVPPHDRVRRGIGRSFQITNLFDGLSVRENLQLAAQSVYDESYSPRELLFRPTTELTAVDETAGEVLDAIGLADRANETAKTLDYGNRRRLEIGVVLATDPDLVLLDEPTAGLSGTETRQILDLVETLLADQTLVLIEHDIDLVMKISDRITVLNRGAILAEGTPSEVEANQAVQDAYLRGVSE